MINIGEKELCFLPYSLSLCRIRYPKKLPMAGFQGFHLSLSIESELSLPSQMKFLSLLSDWISEKTCRWQAFKAFIFAVN